MVRGSTAVATKLVGGPLGTVARTMEQKWLIHHSPSHGPGPSPAVRTVEQKWLIHHSPSPGPSPAARTMEQKWLIHHSCQQPAIPKACHLCRPLESFSSGRVLNIDNGVPKSMISGQTTVNQGNDMCIRPLER